MKSDSTPPNSSLAIEAAILDACLEALDAGNPLDLAQLQTRFPDHREVVAREFERLQLEHDADRPTRIAHYVIERELGRGGQGRVYLATDGRLGRPVALKVLPDHGPLSARDLARFRREAEITARLDHPGICTVLDAGQAAGTVYIAMRYLEGQSLAQRNTQRREQSIVPSREDVLADVRMFEKVARAVHAAHQAGVIHRDLKPGNVMLTASGDPVVLDFGLAARDSDQSPAGRATLTRSGEVFGTPAYMSPEQLRGASSVDPRADVYSLAASLFECVTLCQPIEGNSREALFHAILETPPRDPKSLNPAIPRDVCTVLNIALEKPRGRRYRTAQDFAEDLRRIAGYEPIVARPPNLWKRGWRWVQRNRVVASAAAVLFVGLGVALLTSLHFLDESEDSRRELAAALDDIRTGQETKRRRWLDDRLTAGYQALYSADPRPARAIFAELLDEAPDNLDALAGGMWLEINAPHRALAVLEAHERPEHDVRELAWLRGFVLAAAGDEAAAARQFANAGPAESSLRLYFEALHGVHGFLRPVSREVMSSAYEGFLAASLRSKTPRFHHFHSMLMTAAYLKDTEKLTTAAGHLEFHWPDDPATHDAIAQFFIQVDRERAVRSLHRLVDLDTGASPYCGLAHVARLDGDAITAAIYLDRAVERDPTFAAAHFMRGELSMTRGDAALARNAFWTCLGHEPTFTQAANGLELAHAGLKDAELAEQDAIRLLRLDAEAYAQLAARLRNP